MRHTQPESISRKKLFVGAEKKEWAGSAVGGVLRQRFPDLKLNSLESLIIDGEMLLANLRLVGDSANFPGLQIAHLNRDRLPVRGA